MEGLALQSEVMDLQADPDARMEGIVMDARVDKGIGVIVDCIVRWGSLQRGDIVVSGTHFGRVKALKESATGTALQKVLSSQPVQIVVFRTCPKAGDPLICVECEETAMQLVERRGAAKTFHDSSEFWSDTAHDDTDTEVIGVMAQQRIRRSAAEAEAEARATVDNDETKNSQDSVGDGGNDVIRIPVVVKADADGTLAALRESIVATGQESEHNIVVDPIVSGVGPHFGERSQVGRPESGGHLYFQHPTERPRNQRVAGRAGRAGPFPQGDLLPARPSQGYLCRLPSAVDGGTPARNG